MLEEILKRRWQSIEKDEKALRILAKHYAEVKNETPCCLPVLQQFFTSIKITNYQKKSQMKKTPTSIYKLKKGISPIYVPSKHMHVTADNLTDELAQAILEMPNGASKFEYIPSEEEVDESGSGSGSGDPAAEREAQVAELSKLTKAVLQEECRKAGRPEEEYKKLNKTDLINYLIDGAK